MACIPGYLAYVSNRFFILLRTRYDGCLNKSSLGSLRLVINPYLIF